jgi:hypothetical protein
MNPLMPVAFAATAGVALLTAVHFAQGQAQPAARVVSQFNLPQMTIDNRNIDELSGLAWNDTSQKLFAISDDNVLFEFALKGDAAAPTGIDILKQTKLPQTNLKSKNAEALDFVVMPNGTASSQLLASYEDVNKIAMIDTDALIPTEKIALPESVAVDPKNGVEALAALTNGEVAYAYELPPRANRRGVHSLFISSQDRMTRKLDFPVNTDHKWNVKAIDHLGENTFLVLLSDRIKNSDSYRNMLLRVDGCPAEGDGTCLATPVNTNDTALEGPAFEGMTLTSSGLLFLVDDRKSDEGPATLLVMQTQNLKKATN